MISQRAARGSGKRRVAAVVIACALLAAFAWAWGMRAGLMLSPYERRVLPLVRALGSRRAFSARLGGGFRPGPIADAARGEGKPGEVAVLAAAAIIEGEAKRDGSPENQRALSAAHLILGNYDEAIQGLETLSRSTPGDSGVWSDLGAAYLTRAEKTGKSADLPRALEHVLHAREVSPLAREAQVNHALVLDRMHLHDEAQKAWTDARAGEIDADWIGAIDELRAHAESEEWINRDRFLEGLSQAETRGDLNEVERLARDSPEGVRSWLNSQGLGTVQDARGREALARLQPVLARTLKDPDVPDTIAQVLGLPNAALPSVRLYAEIATLHESNRWGEAEGLLARVQGPASLPPNPRRWRDLWQAVTDLQHGDSARARERLDALISSIDETKQPFLKGRAHYTRSVIASSGGQPDLAIHHRREAARLFNLAGEASWAAFAGQQAGEAHGKLGLTEVDWDERLDTLKHAPRFFNPRTALLSITVVGDDLVRSDLPRAAAAVYRSAHDRAAAAHLEDSAADTAAGIALALRTIDKAAARQAALTASEMASRIEDPLLRARMSGEALRVRATVEPENDALVTEALEWLGNRGSWGRQIPLMTSHGLALAASGRMDAAKSALDESVALYETKRPRDPELSDAGSDQIRPAYAALAEIEARRGADAAILLGLARRYWMAASNVAVDVRLTSSAGGCTLAFVPTSNSVLSWFTCGAGPRFHREAILATERRALVNGFVSARQAGLPGEREGRLLSALLLSPWKEEIGKAQSLRLTVTEDLARVPFAALPLHDGAQLGASTALTYSPLPSAAVAPGPAGPWRSPLIVTAAPEDKEFPLLPHAAAESSALAQRVGGRFLHHEQATVDNTLAFLPRSDLFYFSGHALVNASRPFDSSLVLVDASNKASFLTIRRVRALDLRGMRLAVLAGCSTAEGGDVGSMTLAGAFLAAGAQSVVGTLWPVRDDAMSRLMPRFFEHLDSEGSPARALARLRNEASLTNADRAVVDALAVSELARPASSSFPLTTH